MPGLSKASALDAVRRMTARMRSRGPDAEGEWAGDGVVLGHRRLAIVDLDARSNQPMASADGRYLIVFNGEIYNFRELRHELELLVQADPEIIETTLLIHPGVLIDFVEYNDFLRQADAVLRHLGLEGVVQIASFHPHYRFAGTRHDDLSNATNRSPYPTLHLLREASVDRAVAAFPHPEAIYETNLRTIEDLGAQGWAALQANWTPR